jgi:hypothetical protein
VNIILSMLGIGKLIRNGAMRAVGWVFASVTHALIVLCGILAIVGVREGLNADKWHSEADHAKTALQAVSAAQKSALAAQLAVNKATSEKSAQIAKDNDNANQDAYRSGAVDYANSHRMRSCAVSGASGATLAAAKGDTAESDNRSGEGSIMVSQADFNALNENTERLLKVHDWGDKMIAAGLAGK